MEDHGEMRSLQTFPLDHLAASRADQALQDDNAASIDATRVNWGSTTICPSCGASGGELSWFYFCSPPWTWERLCGSAGVIAFCDRDQRQVASFISIMN